MSVTPSSLTVLTDGLSAVVNLTGVPLFTDSGLGTPVTFPQTVSADTTWYAAPLTVPGKRPPIGVNGRWAATGFYFSLAGIDSLPATVDLPEGTVIYGAAPASNGGGTPVDVTDNNDGTTTFVVG